MSGRCVCYEEWPEVRGIAHQWKECQCPCHMKEETCPHRRVFMGMLPPGTLRPCYDCGEKVLLPEGEDHTQEEIDSYPKGV